MATRAGGGMELLAGHGGAYGEALLPREPGTGRRGDILDDLARVFPGIEQEQLVAALDLTDDRNFEEASSILRHRAGDPRAVSRLPAPALRPAAGQGDTLEATNIEVIQQRGLWRARRDMAILVLILVAALGVGLKTQYGGGSSAKKKRSKRRRVRKT